MKSRNLEISPQTLLLAIFEHSREIGGTTSCAICAQLGASKQRIAAPLRALREAGYVQEDCTRLTFIGLAAATQVLGALAWEDGESRRHVA